MKYLLLILLFLTACIEERNPLVYKKVDKKYCVANCRAYEFKNFHNSGSSWGTGSSSMNGLSQSAIYDRVIDECNTFYKDNGCCSIDYAHQYDHYVSHFHGGDFTYGECLHPLKEE